MRGRLEDSPAFQAAQRMGAVADVPLVEAVRAHRRRVVVGFWIVAAVAVTSNVFYVFLPGYLATQAAVGLRDALGTAAAGLVFGSAVAPVFGRVSDRVGRRPVLICGVLALLAVTMPAASLAPAANRRACFSAIC